MRKIPSDRLDPRLAPLIDCVSVDTLEAEDGTVFAVWEDGRLGYINEAWGHFARENEGEPVITEHYPLGTSVYQGMAPPMRRFFASLVKKALATGRVVAHSYECSSPTTYRLYHQSLYPVGSRRAVVAVNSLVETHAHPGPSVSHEPDPSLYRDADGFLSQCSYCRRVQRRDRPGQWDWIPQWVARLPQRTSHTYCPTCFDYYIEFRDWSLRNSQCQ